MGRFYFGSCRHATECVGFNNYDQRQGDFRMIMWFALDFPDTLLTSANEYTALVLNQNHLLSKNIPSV